MSGPFQKIRSNAAACRVGKRSLWIVDREEANRLQGSLKVMPVGREIEVSANHDIRRWAAEVGDLFQGCDQAIYIWCRKRLESRGRGGGVVHVDCHKGDPRDLPSKKLKGGLNHLIGHGEQGFWIEQGGRWAQG